METLAVACPSGCRPGCWVTGSQISSVQKGILGEPSASIYHRSFISLLQESDLRLQLFGHMSHQLLEHTDGCLIPKGCFISVKVWPAPCIQVCLTPRS